jgi:hypothetical protein
LFSAAAATIRLYRELLTGAENLQRRDPVVRSVKQ